MGSNIKELISDIKKKCLDKSFVLNKNRQNRVIDKKDVELYFDDAINAVKGNSDNWISTKHAIPKVEGTYDVIVKMTSMSGSKTKQATSEFKWIKIGNGDYAPSWAGDFDWKKVTHFKP